MTQQPRLLADYAAVPTARERRAARTHNRAAQLGMFEQFCADLTDAARTPCPVCASTEHAEQQCPHGTAPTLTPIEHDHQEVTP